jgi:SRF-type transcription factor (DNA-binding and dimerisation domain)
MHTLQEARQQQQAFTKRKRTIMDKAFELSQAADAKVSELITCLLNKQCRNCTGDHDGVASDAGVLLLHQSGGKCLCVREP